MIANLESHPTDVRHGDANGVAIKDDWCMNLMWSGLGVQGQSSWQ